MQRDLKGWIDRGAYRRASLKNYLSMMSQGNDRVIFDDHVADVLREQGFNVDEDRSLARSIYEPEKLYDSLALYGPDNQSDFWWDEDLRRGFDFAYGVFSKPKRLETLRPLDGPVELMKAIKKEKSSGLPMMKTKADSFVYSLDRESQVRKGLKSPNPCVAYKRTQENFKTRLVWGYPMEMTLMESRFARPLIDVFKSSRTTMAFGLKKHVLGAYLEYNVHPKQVGGYVYCLDYSKFDSSMSASLIRAAFRILETWFSEEDKLQFGWDQIIKYFICTPIVMPDGHLYTGKRHGVPSGSYFTQIVDSIVNTMLIGALASHHSVKLPFKKLYVLGDDSIFNLPKRIPLSEIASFLSYYGVTVNVDKSKVDEMHFLGAFWNRCLPDERHQKLVAKAVFPETFRVYSDDKSTRQQALELLASYASQYKSAWSLIPPIGNNDQHKAEWSLLSVRHRWMSGSDKYHWEEGLNLQDLKLENDFSPVHKRLLL